MDIFLKHLWSHVTSFECWSFSSSTLNFGSDSLAWYVSWNLYRTQTCSTKVLPGEYYIEYVDKQHDLYTI